MLKRLRDNICAKRWPAYIEVPLVSLVYLAVIVLAILLFAVCCFLVLVLPPLVGAWFHSL